MTTLHARNWALYAKRTDKVRDYSRIWAMARTAFGIAILVAMLGAAFALRVLMFVHLP